MKVCMLVTNSLKKDPRVQREAETAFSAGCDVTVVGSRDLNYDEKFIKSRKYNVVITDMPDKYRGTLKSNFKKVLREIMPVIRMIKVCRKIKPDIIHANDFDTLPAAYIAAKKVGAKVVYDSHEIYSGMPQLNSRPMVKMIIKAIEGHIIKRVYAVTSVSNAAAAVLADMYKIRLPHVVTNCSFKVEPESLCEKNDGFEVVYQGIMSPYRGYDELEKAASLVDDGVTIVLRGYGTIKDKLVQYAKDNNLSNVRFDPPIEIAELIPMASKSMVGTVLTVPVSDNFKYTVSNKIFEYIQARIPVILSDVPEHRYINDKYDIGIIVNEVTPENIAEAINKLYRSPELYERYKKNVCKAAEELCWENEGAKLMNIYKCAAK